MITGRPIRSIASSASRSFSMTPVPGRIGTPAALMSFRADTLSPMLRITSGCGPIQSRPQRCTTSAKCAFSARKP